MTEPESQPAEPTDAELAAQLFPQQMPYRLITPVDQHTMIRERVAALEREHFSKQLLLWENRGRTEIEQQLRAEMMEIQRRIELHVGAPTVPGEHSHAAEQQVVDQEVVDEQAPTNGAGGANRAARRARHR